MPPALPPDLPIDATAFARDWAAGWNSHDLDRIMAHYREDILFRSRKALALVGASELRGVAALRAYWADALARQPALHFEIEAVFGGHEMLVILYRNHAGVRATETLWFDPEGRVFQAAACHEATAAA